MFYNLKKLRLMGKILKIQTIVIASLSVLLVFCCFDTLCAKTIKSVKVIKIVDGDSIIVASPWFEGIKVRLWGIDTPEYRQPYSKAAAKITRKLLQHQTVDLLVKDHDDYGRVVAVVKMENGDTANELLVKSGYAWVHIYYCKEPVCRTWRALEAEARAKGVGLWQEPEPVAPWIWKRNNKYRKKK